MFKAGILYEWVDEAIAIIKASGLFYEAEPFATPVEGKYEPVIKLINNINEHLFRRNCTEWITRVQIQIRNDEDITGNLKTAKHKM